MKNKKKYSSSEEKPVHKFSDIDLSGIYSYASYLRWEFDERVELIKGRIFKMGAPSSSHQRVSIKMLRQFIMHLEHKSCEVFHAPFDVRFFGNSKNDNEVFTVVQPDICVICDPGKIDERGCIGAPDIVVEILSPGNNKKELQIKYALYEEFGVKEYWIVHPIKRIVIKHVLNTDGKYSTEGPFSVKDRFASNILPGFLLNLEEVFV